MALGVVMIVLPEPVLARSNDLTAAVSRYPQIDNTDLDSCNLCHGSSYSLNPYGSDYDDHGFAAIETIDSDGDGHLNIDEINALTSPGDASDYPHDDLLIRAQYPAIAGTRLDSCNLCHSSGSSLNPYGQAYNNNGRNLAAFGLIETADSDGDSFSNIDEINALTFPGDGEDHPMIESEDMTRAREKYPDIAGTPLDSCSLCHSSGSSLNPYGVAYFGGGRNLAAFGLIETDDSDGDEFTNLEEINALTFPGNVNDSPASQHDHEILLVQHYPVISDTRLATPTTCDVCHNADFTLNAYGADYAGTLPPYDFAAINNIDSDNDGFVNIDEIELFFYPGNANDHPDSDLVLFRSVYPAFHNSEQDACILCHTDEFGPDLNPYGADYLSNGRTRAALVAIENFDSDGDGYFNLEELELGYCPGISDCPTHSESLLIQYPQVEGTPLDSCDLCHDTSVTGWPLNPYGNNYLDAGNDRFAFGLIELLDSDGDGYVNIDEINALTLPGDSTDTPAQNNDANVVFLPIILK
jgi:cytochrome c5